ncbi:hypothetical protein CR513_25287, partial [Mucuna pruriens]
MWRTRRTLAGREGNADRWKKDRPRVPDPPVVQPRENVKSTHLEGGLSSLTTQHSTSYGASARSFQYQVVRVSSGYRPLNGGVSTIEKLIQDSYLGHFIRRKEDEKRDRSRTPGQDRDQGQDQFGNHRGSQPRPTGQTPPHWGKVATISGVGSMAKMSVAARKRYSWSVLIVHERPTQR